MKINEIIIESSHIADPKKLPHDHVAAIKGAKSIPALSMNKSDGSSYMQYRHGLALACAGAGDTPDAPMKADGAFSGDPVFLSYTDEEDEMLDRSSKIVGASPVNRLSDNKSREHDTTHKTSPVPHNSGISWYHAKYWPLTRI